MESINICFSTVFLCILFCFVGLLFLGGEACLFFVSFWFWISTCFHFVFSFFQICHWKNANFTEILESNYDYMIFNIYKILEGLVSLWKAYVWDWAEMCLKFIGFKIKIAGYWLVDFVVIGSSREITHLFWRQEVQDQGGGRFGFWWEISTWFIDGHLLPMSYGFPS